MRDVLVTREAFNPQKRTSSTPKHKISSFFSISFASFWNPVLRQVRYGTSAACDTRGLTVSNKSKCALHGPSNMDFNFKMFTLVNRFFYHISAWDHWPVHGDLVLCSAIPVR